MAPLVLQVTKDCIGIVWEYMYLLLFGNYIHDKTSPSSIAVIVNALFTLWLV